MANLYLIPCPISEESPVDCLTPRVLTIIKNTRIFLVENLRSARRFISSTKQGIVLDDLVFFELHKIFCQVQMHLHQS